MPSPPATPAPAAPRKSCPIPTTWTRCCCARRWAASANPRRSPPPPPSCVCLPRPTSPVNASRWMAGSCVTGSEPASRARNMSASHDPELLRRLLRAKDRMDAASHEAWPVQRLARVSHVSAAHFARAFKDAFGLPPHRYLLTRRIERATALLRDTEMPILDIALQTGWNSLGTFGRTFRDITGESPRQVRARQRAATHALELVPGCFLSAAQRPDLTIAVSEKRRREAGH